jgi:hypothetical protein
VTHKGIGQIKNPVELATALRHIPAEVVLLGKVHILASARTQSQEAMFLQVICWDGSRMAGRTEGQPTLSGKDQDLIYCYTELIIRVIVAPLPSTLLTSYTLKIRQFQ